MEKIQEIGRCKGCDRVSKLDNGVCDDCLKHRGRKWAETANRCRQDRDYAVKTYNKITSERGKRLFMMMFGDTIGEVEVDKITQGSDIPPPPVAQPKPRFVPRMSNTGTMLYLVK